MSDVVGNIGLDEGEFSRKYRYSFLISEYL
jgi:hypothetical protein